MKICVFTDTHLGARNNCSIFNEYFLKFYNDIFFPYLEKNQIKYVVSLGDLGEYRKQINLSILDSWNKNVFERLKDYRCFFISGNHDLFYRHNNEISLQSSLQLDKKFGFELITTHPRTIVLDGRSIDLIPWISSGNQKEILEFITSSSSALLLGHLEISGALMTPGMYCQESHLPTSLLNQYHKVLSGHFHLRSTLGNVTYIGNPYEIIWSDYGYDKGFAILDSETLELEYINNPYHMFEKIVVDDTLQISDLDLSRFNNKHVKLYVSQGSKRSKVETLLALLEQQNLLSLSVKEEELIDNKSDDKEKENLGIMSNTMDYVKLYINDLYQNQSMRLDKEKMIGTMNRIYQQAQQQE